MGLESDFYLQCLNCRNYIGSLPPMWKQICKAFPYGIPQEILNGDFDHRKPYHGDNGIRFTWKPKKERVWIY